jgi:hypothetical protein
MDCSRRFLVLHGWQNRRPVEHWQWQLVDSLRASGEQVLYPQLPSTDRPVLEEWSGLVRAELAQLGNGERVVIAHSLAVPLWLHLAPSLTADESVERVLLVAPPSPMVLRGFDEVAAFGEIVPDPAVVAIAARSTRFVCSDDDPYCPEGIEAAYADLDLDLDVLHGAGHINPDAGYGAWPAVLAWCREPSTRLTPRTSMT